MMLSKRQKKILKWVGYPLLALVVFIFTLAYTFPYDRLKGKIISSLNEKYDVSIASIKPSLIPGTFTIKNMMLRTRPETPEQKAVVIVIDSIEVDVGVLSALGYGIGLTDVGVEVAAKVEGGTLELEVEHAKSSNTLTVNAKTKMLPLASLPGVAESVGLPMTGGLDAEVSIRLPKGKWSKADGKLKIGCVACTVGDGVAKLKMKPNPANKRRRRRVVFQDDGVTVPKLNLGMVTGTIEINKGKGVIKDMGAKSQDGFLKIEGEIDFKDPFKNTMFPGCLTFGFSEELKAREAKFMGIEAGLPPHAKQEDGSYALPLKGKLASIGVDPRRRCGESKPASVVDRQRNKPRISTTFDKDPKTGEPKPRTMPELKPKDDKDDKLEAEEDKKENAKPIETGPRLSKGRGDDVAVDEDEAEPDEEVDGDEEEESEDEEEESEGDDEEEEEPEGEEEEE